MIALNLDKNMSKLSKLLFCVAVILTIQLVLFGQAQAETIINDCVGRSGAITELGVLDDREPTILNLCVGEVLIIKNGYEPFAAEIIKANIVSYNDKKASLLINNKKQNIGYKKLTQVANVASDNLYSPAIPFYLSYLGKKNGQAQIYLYFGFDAAESNPLKDKDGATCTDSDKIGTNYDNTSTDNYGYKNVYIKGVAVGKQKTNGIKGKFTDQCLSKNQLKEYFCNQNTGRVDWATYNCADGCVAGTCKTKNSLFVKSLAMPSNKAVSVNWPGGWETLGVYNFSAINSKEDIEIKSFEISTIFNDPELSSYKDYKQVWLIAPGGGTVYGEKITPESNTIKFNFDNGELIVKAREEISIFLIAAFNDIGEGKQGTSGHLVGYKQPENVVAVGLKSKKSVKIGYDKRLTNFNYLRRVSPSLSTESAFIDKKLTMSGNEDEYLYYWFSVFPQEGLDMSLYQFTFEFYKSNHNMQISDLTLYQSLNNIWTQLNLEPGQLTGSIWRANASSWKTIYPSSFVPVGTNEAPAFRLKAKLTREKPDDQVYIRLAGENDAQSPTNNLNSNIFELENLGANFIWSDNSTKDHGLGSKDWIDGRAIRGFNKWYGPL